jgi:NAD(P)-dependent dehydrogenase (short-subunit alcohol dehydrogenase family)
VKRFTGKTALITGGGSGIGRATAVRFAREGAAVVLLDIEDSAEVAAAEIRAQYGPAIGIVGDVRQPEDCRRAVDIEVERFGGVDVVFCNAGVFEGGTVETQTVEQFERQLDVMVKGTFLTCKYAVPALRARGGGAIVLSGSNCSHIGCAGRFAYTAAKAAMPLLAKQLSNDYFHSAHIRVNCVSPGYVRTRMTERIWREQTRVNDDAAPPPAVTANWQTAEAIAGVVLFLASDEAADITGVTVPVSRTGLLRVAGMR